MGNQQDTKSTTINQKSFVKAIKRYVLTANNPISVLDPNKQQKIFLNYWKAIANLLDGGKPTVLFKYNGVELFCRFSIPMFHKLQNINDFKVATIEKMLQETFDNLAGEAVGVGNSDWWLSTTGLAGGMNSGAISKVNQELSKALLNIQSSAGEILL
jgi:hypothetical protein